MHEDRYRLKHHIEYLRGMFFVNNPFERDIQNLNNDMILNLQSSFGISTTNDGSFVSSIWPFIESCQKETLCSSKLSLNIGINLYGYIHADFGLGEDARRLYELIVSLGIPVNVFSTAPSPYTKTSDSGIPNKSWNEIPKYKINVFCMSVFEMLKLYGRCPERFEGFYNIAYSPWELSSFSKNFRFLDYIVSEYWVPTEFVKKSYSSLLKKPVHKIPYIVEIDEGIKRKKNKAVFRYLTVADLNSSEARKNVFGTIDCFQSAYQSDEKVELYVKVMGRISIGQLEKLNTIIEADDRIVVINDALDRSELLSLIASSDALLSLHRSEGFGRLPLEAMNLSVPVVATNYSGVTDYLRWFNSYRVKYVLIAVKEGEYPYVPVNAVWADPSHDDAVRQIRMVYSNAWLRNFRKFMARRLTVRHYTLRTLKGKYQKAFKHIFSSLEVGKLNV